MKRKNFKHWISTLLITATVVAFSLFLFSKGNFRSEAIGQGLSKLGPAVAGTLLLVACLQMVIQAVRLYVLSNAVLRLELPWAMRAFSVGQMMNALLPGRAGDLYKVAQISTLHGGDEEANTGTVIGVVFAADKFADLAATISLALIFAPVALEQVTEGERFVEVSQRYGPWVMSLGIALALMAAMAGKLQSAFWAAKQILETVFVRISIRRYLVAYALAVASFSVECGSLVYLAASMSQVEITFFDALWVMIVVNLGIAIPLTFANVGPFEASMIFGLSRFEIQTETALAIAIAHHGIQIASTFIMSAFTVCLPIRRRGVAPNQSPA